MASLSLLGQLWSPDIMEWGAAHPGMPAIRGVGAIIYLFVIFILHLSSGELKVVYMLLRPILPSTTILESWVRL